MLDFVRINPKPVVDQQDEYQTATVPVQAGVVPGLATILQIRTRAGKRARIVSYNTGVQAGGENKVTFHLVVNGNPVYPYHAGLNQWGTPENPVAIPVQLEVGQTSLIEVKAENSDTVNTYDATARVVVFYEDF